MFVWLFLNAVQIETAEDGDKPRESLCWLIVAAAAVRAAVVVLYPPLVERWPQPTATVISTSRERSGAGEACSRIHHISYVLTLISSRTLVHERPAHTCTQYQHVCKLYTCAQSRLFLVRAVCVRYFGFTT